MNSKMKVCQNLQKLEDNWLEQSKTSTKHKQNIPVSNKLKQLVCANMNDGMSVVDVANAFSLSPATVYNIKKAVSDDQCVLTSMPKKTTNPGPKFIYNNSKVIVEVYLLVDERPTALL